MDLVIAQKEAGRRIGTNQFMVINWEKGRTQPAVRFVSRIIQFLGYDPFPKGVTVLRAVAPRQVAGLYAAPAVLDRELLALAGLDPAVFRPGTADFVLPGVNSDTRTAWVGSYAGLPGFAICAEPPCRAALSHDHDLADVIARLRPGALRLGSQPVQMGAVCGGVAVLVDARAHGR